MIAEKKKGFEASFSKNLLSSSFIISEIPRENTSGFSSKNGLGLVLLHLKSPNQSIVKGVPTF